MASKSLSFSLSYIYMYNFFCFLWFSLIIKFTYAFFTFNFMYPVYNIFFCKLKDTFLSKNFIFRWSGDASVRRNRCTNLVCLSLNRSVAKWTPWKYHHSLKIPVALPVVLWWGIQRFQDGPPMRLKKVVQFVHRNRQKFLLVTWQFFIFLRW